MPNVHSSQLTDQQNHIEWLKSLDPAKVKVNKGKMYEVGLNAHPDDFLDWDKPLSQQSEKVRKALEVLGVENQELRGNDIYANIGRGQKPGETPHYSPDSKYNLQKATDDLKAAGIKGIRYLDQGSRISRDADAIRKTLEVERQRMSSLVGSERRAIKQRYIDALEADLKKSEQAGNTSNYVVFDDAIIEIMKKYGIAFPAAAAMLKAQQDAQAKQKPKHQ